ncbi:aspartate/glutamate racemase family protein [Fulvimarina sp. 2208YS6-2-32]|uniref:Aspartate/glutamate racemase family protein n=1 Tax=Fulvimarina uroteuthidis TaxID=3098149 RepID=A0ABU5I542_9HYPH|nr:aspartate/glutamate racemase family protein [Fulvimarina sp. 2208YS6-2-32]MDY8109914.1 aspartate/glutamate racemase family protein [Fulvimarina sp. 2208YS6-2-32]
MRLLLLNPNTSRDITDLITEAARSVAPASVELTSVTADRGVPYIATRAEAVIGAGVALEILAEREGQYDAAIVAAFGDPGLGAARELFSVPIVGMAEAGMLTACMLGGRFAIVTFAEALGPWYRECVAMHRLDARCAGVLTLDNAFRSVGDVQNERADMLVELARRAVEEHGADVVVLAGAPLAGLARKVRDRIEVPIVDCVAAAVLQAVTLATLNPRAPAAGSFKRPMPKESIGLAKPLADWIGHR